MPPVQRDSNQLLEARGAVHDLWVDEGARRLGIARRLAHTVIAALASKCAPRSVLQTAAVNVGAQRLCSRLHFAPQRGFLCLTAE